MVKARPLLYAVPGLLTSGEAEPAVINGDRLSVMGEA